MAYKLQVSRWKGVITNYRLLGCGALQFGRHLQNFLLSCRQRQKVPWNITTFLIPPEDGYVHNHHLAHMFKFSL